VFKNEDCKEFFIKQIREYNLKFDFELLGFIIMDNHYHLIVRTNKDPLDEIMFNINNVFVKYLNRELNRTGHAFESRYKCKRIESDANLLWLLRYVHRNPLRARIVNDLDAYAWSSHRYYREGAGGLVNTSFILDILSTSKRNSIKKYLKLMNVVGNDEDDDVDFEVIKGKVFDEWSISKGVNVAGGNKNMATRESLDELADRVFCRLETKMLILKGCKTRDLTPLKLAFVEEAMGLKYTLKEIGEYLNSSGVAVSLMVARHRG
jgi:REP element-mobilizing transposase RayT